MYSWSEAAGSAAWALGLMMVGVLLVLWARRGRRIGDHPTCRRCDFDLFGNDTAERCPECGSDLSRRRARATGLRQVRRGWWWAGMSTAVACGIWGVGAFVLTFAGVQTAQLKPTALLLRELSASSGATRAQAWFELDSRRRAGELSPEEQIAALDGADEYVTDPNDLPLTRLDVTVRQLWENLPEGHAADLLPYWQALTEVAADPHDPRQIDAATRLLAWYDRGALLGGADEVPVHLFATLIEPILQVQADPEAQWSPVLGDVLMVAHLHGLLPPEALERYARNGVRLELETRPNLRIGDPLPYIRRVFMRRHSESKERPGNPDWACHITSASLTFLEDRRIVANESLDMLLRGSWERGSLGRLELDAQQMPEPGEKSTALLFELEQGILGQPPVATWQHTHTAPLTLLPADGNSVELLTDAATGAAVREALSLAREYGETDDAEEGTASILVSPNWDGIRMFLNWENLPCDLSFAVYLRDPETGRTWGPVEHVSEIIRARPGGYGGSILIRAGVEDVEGFAEFSGDELDVILQPDPEHAAGTVDVMRIWGKPIILEREPVHHDRPRRRPKVTLELHNAR